MARLQYLTVQDILWINHKLAGKVLGFRYATLEEATFYQYSYGESTDVPAQAVRFLRGFLRLRPFDALNEPTGLVGAIAFAKVNGRTVNLEDVDDPISCDWIRSEPERFAELVQESHEDLHGHIGPNVRATIESVLRDYSKTIGALSPADQLQGIIGI